MIIDVINILTFIKTVHVQITEASVVTSMTSMTCYFESTRNFENYTSVMMSADQICKFTKIYIFFTAFYYMSSMLH